MKKIKITDITQIALSAAFIALCSMICVPTAVPITLQSFAVYCIAALFGSKKGVLATLVYLALGAAGLPVFSAFRGGLGHLFSQTGGYLTALIAVALIVGQWKKKRTTASLVSLMVISTVVLYICGTLWFALVGGAEGGIAKLLASCIAAFIIPDALKIALACVFIQRLSRKFK